MKSLPSRHLNVYDHSFGWNMFDFSFLTPMISEFLSQEVQALDALFEKNSQYNHLLEVGCGYGRLMNWAVQRGLKYQGWDLVSWMIDLGLARSERLRRDNPKAAIQLKVHDIENIRYVAGDAGAGDVDIVFFPFNCFGNLPSPAVVARSLSYIGGDVIVSSFNHDPTSTRTRMEYYSNCGFRNLSLETKVEGVLISSSEGLESSAYSDSFYKRIFSDFELVSSSQFGPCGRLLFFRNLKKRVGQQDSPKSCNGTEYSSDAFPSSKCDLLRLSALLEGVARFDGLLQFDTVFGQVWRHKKNSLQVICPRNWPLKTAVRIEFMRDHLVPDVGVGIVNRVERYRDGYLLTLESSLSDCGRH